MTNHIFLKFEFTIFLLFDGLPSKVKVNPINLTSSNIYSITWRGRYGYITFQTVLLRN